MFEGAVNWLSSPGRLGKVGALLGLMILPMSVTVAQAKPAKPAIEPKALETLRGMGAYLRSLKEFSVQGEGARDEIMKNGQKIQINGTVAYQVRAPDHMRAEIKTDRKQREFIYDGKTLTVYAPRMHYYATVNAPPTIGAMLDSAQNRYGLEFPIADLFLWGTPKDEMSKLTYASLVGPSTINGIECDQYAFRQPGVDWQLWVQKGNAPLPIKLVITSRENAAQPQYVATLKWDTEAKLSDATFAFVPPKDASKIMIVSSGGR
jgi:hypothetical protein